MAEGRLKRWTRVGSNLARFAADGTAATAAAHHASDRNDAKCSPESSVYVPSAGENSSSDSDSNRTMPRRIDIDTASTAVIVDVGDSETSRTDPSEVL